MPFPALPCPTAGSIRTKLPEECPHGAMGRYLVQRFTIEREPFPTLASDRNDFYTTPLWRGQCPDRSISYDELASSLKTSLPNLDIVIRKVTHAMRVAGARRMDEAGVDDQVIARMGAWLYDAMYRSYLLFFKPEGLLAAGGWPGAAQKQFDTFWAARFCVDVPPELIQLLLPILPGLRREVRELGAKAGNSKKSIVKVLEYLAIVVVQDALELAANFPQQPAHALLLQDPMFQQLQQVRAAWPGGWVGGCLLAGRWFLDGSGAGWRVASRFTTCMGCQRASQHSKHPAAMPPPTAAGLRVQEAQRLLRAPAPAQHPGAPVRCAGHAGAAADGCGQQQPAPRSGAGAGCRSRGCCRQRRR